MIAIRSFDIPGPGRGRNGKPSDLGSEQPPSARKAKRTPTRGLLGGYPVVTSPTLRPYQREAHDENTAAMQELA